MSEHIPDVGKKVELAITEQLKADRTLYCRILSIIGINARGVLDYSERCDLASLLSKESFDRFMPEIDALQAKVDELEKEGEKLHEQVSTLLIYSDHKEDCIVTPEPHCECGFSKIIDEIKEQ